MDAWSHLHDFTRLALRHPEGHLDKIWQNQVYWVKLRIQTWDILRLVMEAWFWNWSRDWMNTRGLRITHFITHTWEELNAGCRHVMSGCTSSCIECPRLDSCRSFLQILSAVWSMLLMLKMPGAQWWPWNSKGSYYRLWMVIPCHDPTCVNVVAICHDMPRYATRVR